MRNVLNRILKVELAPLQSTAVKMPKGSEVLSANIQMLSPTPKGAKVMLWYRTPRDIMEPMEDRIFFVSGTGIDLPTEYPLVFIATCISSAHTFVWHVFEVLDK